MCNNFVLNIDMYQKHAYFGSWIIKRGNFMCNTLAEVFSRVTCLFSYSCVLKTRLFRFMDYRTRYIHV